LKKEEEYDKQIATKILFTRQYLTTNLHSTGPNELLKMLCDVISKFSGTDIIISPGLKYFSEINPRPVSIHNRENESNSDTN